MHHPTTITLTPQQRKQLTTAREAAGLHQGELAAKCGCTRNMLCQVERGRKSPSWGLLCAICWALELEVDLKIRRHYR
jgi:transcriptional regulator with XRE-family HTH domain